MSRKIIGVTVGTPLSPAKIAEKLKPVKTVNGVEPDENGNVELDGKSGATIYYSTDDKNRKVGDFAMFPSASIVDNDGEMEVGDAIVTAGGLFCRVTKVVQASNIASAVVVANMNGVGIASISIEEIKEASVISFSISKVSNHGDLTYQAREGMTWREWCESEYNTSEGEYRWQVNEYGSIFSEFGDYVDADGEDVIQEMTYYAYYP